jgi:transposase
MGLLGPVPKLTGNAIQCHARSPKGHDKPHCGRHPAYLTAEEEQELLAPFLGKAAQGEVVVAAPVRQAYEEKLGHRVHHSMGYRALHRQGWRKVQPRPRPPKADADAQEEFKKSFRHCSQKK